MSVRTRHAKQNTNVHRGSTASRLRESIATQLSCHIAIRRRNVPGSEQHVFTETFLVSTPEYYLNSRETLERAPVAELVTNSSVESVLLYLLSLPPPRKPRESEQAKFREIGLLRDGRTSLAIKIKIK